MSKSTTLAAARVKAVEADTGTPRALTMHLGRGSLFVGWGGGHCYEFSAVTAMSVLSGVQGAPDGASALLEGDGQDQHTRTLTLVKLGAEVAIIPSFGAGLTVAADELARGYARAMGASW